MHSTKTRLLQVAKPEKTFLIWGLFFLVISSCSSLLFPQLIRWFIDHILTPHKQSFLLPAVAGLFFLFVIQGVAGSLRYYFFTLSGERMVLHLRRRLYSKIMGQNIAFFDAHPTGELMGRLASDCAVLQNTVSVNVSMGLRNLGQVLGGLGFMFMTSWKLSLLMLFFLLFIGPLTLIYGKRIRKISHDFQGALSEASLVAEETLSAARTVKAFVQEQAEINRYERTLISARDVAKKRVGSIAVFMTLCMLLGFLAVSFVLGYGGQQVMNDHLSLGDLTQFLLYLMISAIGAGSLGGLWGDIMAGIGASKRIFDILERGEGEGEGEAKNRGKILSNLQGHIEFKQVTFSYPMRPEMPVLCGIDFDIPVGSMVALVGPSGSGKSTINQLLFRFYEPDQGEILLDGTPIRDLSLNFLRENIGLVSQNPVLISSTIEENIRYGKRAATDEEVYQAAKNANALEFILSFPAGFKTKVGEKGMQLSGGQNQRLAIARAILKSPRILVLDEATSNLDAAAESFVQEALEQLMVGRTTLVMAHRLSTIQKAHKILVIHHGKIVQQGSHQELKNHEEGLYYQLLKKQFLQGKIQMRITLSDSKIHPSARAAIEGYYAEQVATLALAVEKNEWVIVGMALNPFVKKAKNFLDHHQTPYTYLEYGSYWSDWKVRLAIKLWSGWPTYPQVFHRGMLIGGFNDLEKYFPNQVR